MRARRIISRNKGQNKGKERQIKLPNNIIFFLSYKYCAILTLVMVEKKKPHLLNGSAKTKDGEASKPEHVTHKKSKLDKLEGKKVLKVPKSDVENTNDQEPKKKIKKEKKE